MSGQRDEWIKRLKDEPSTKRNFAAALGEMKEKNDYFYTVKI